MVGASQPDAGALQICEVVVEVAALDHIVWEAGGGHKRLHAHAHCELSVSKASMVWSAIFARSWLASLRLHYDAACAIVPQSYCKSHASQPWRMSTRSAVCYLQMVPIPGLTELFPALRCNTDDVCQVITFRRQLFAPMHDCIHTACLLTSSACCWECAPARTSPGALQFEALLPQLTWSASES